MARAITVVEEATRKKFHLDPDAEPKWGPIDSGFGPTTLFRSNGQFVLVERSSRALMPSAKLLSDKEAADWLVSRGFLPPDDVAHLAKWGPIARPATTVKEHAPLATEAIEQSERDADKAPKRRARPFELKAYFACQYALAKNPANKTTRDAWNYLNEHGIDERDDVAGLIGCNIPAKLAAELASYRPPEFSTFEPAVSKGRGAMDDLKHESRAGRPFGKSVVPASQLDKRSVDD